MLRLRPAPAPLLRRILRHSATRFAAFGAAGLAFDLALLAVLTRVTPLPDTAAVTIAFAATYALNFALNRRFAFHAGDGRADVQLARFAPQVGVDYLLTIGAVEALTSLGAGLLAARLLAASTNAVFNYCTYRWWTFRPGRP